jgi:integrase
MITVYLVKKNRTYRDMNKRTTGKATLYQLRWIDPKTAKQVTDTIGKVGEISQTAAKQLRSEKESGINRGEIAVSCVDDVKLSGLQAVKHERDRIRGKRRTYSTRKNWDVAIAYAIKALGDISVSKVRDADAVKIEDYLVEVAGNKRSSNVKLLLTLKGLLAAAVKANVITVNPFADYQPEAEKTVSRSESKLIRFFSNLEVESLLAAARTKDEANGDVWWEALISLALASGLRKTELLHLRWSDLEVVEGCVSVRRRDDETDEATGLRVFEWGGKDRGPKSETAVRDVPIPVLPILDRLRLKSDSPYLFANADRVRVLGVKQLAGELAPNFEIVNDFTRHFNNLQRAAKFVAREIEPGHDWKHSVFHTFRDTFATHAATPVLTTFTRDDGTVVERESSVTISELKTMLGHASTKITERYYVGVHDSAGDRLRTATKRILRLVD